MKSTKLQLSLDFLSNDNSISVAERTSDYIDIIEIGTPFIVREGLGAVEVFHRHFPEIPILADLKIIDGADAEASMAFEAGAEIVTVLALSNDKTIMDTIACAKRYGKAVMADLIEVPDLREKVSALDGKVDYICVHTGVDEQALGADPLEDLKLVREIVRKSKLAVAGGIKADTVKDFLAYKPDILIVGGGITGTDDPEKAAREIRQQIDGIEAGDYE